MNETPPPQTEGNPPALAARVISAGLVVSLCVLVWWTVKVRSTPPPPPSAESRGAASGVIK